MRLARRVPLPLLVQLPFGRYVARLAGHGSSVLVATVSAAFGVGLTSTTGVLAQVIGASDIQSGTLNLVLSFIGGVFIAIALYVGAVVVSNSFSTIVAGRTRTIALMRLIGASARSQRRGIAAEGLHVGILGALLGGALGLVVTVSIVSGGQYFGVIPEGSYRFVSPFTLLPVLAVVVTTLAASWTGSRQVLRVTPIEATGAVVEPRLPSLRGRHLASLILFVVGDIVLLAGIGVGLVSVYGIFVALVGGLLSFTGVVLGAQAIMPRVLRLVGRLFGSDAPARLARENAVRYPERSARTTISLVIGVTLIMTFSVTLASFQRIIHLAQAAQPETYAGTDSVLQITVIVFSVLIGFSAVIAAVGLADNLALNVSQRRRELGLLRSLGFTARQVKRMILLESAQLTTAAVALGVVLGTFYGWAGAQSLIGGIQGSPGIVVPVVPLPMLAIVVVAAALLAVVASIVPARRATRVSPVEALAVT
ncbi:MAG: putative transport system permease protein [Glaciihabitans sp.]|nr:putative transport system permease protein [Glaciihabitans sp.]